MNSVLIGVIVFTLTFLGSMCGLWLRRILPPHQFDSDSRETMKLGIGLVATMSALVLGLITSSAKGTFDTMDKAVSQTATQILALDRVLARYGPETDGIREGIKHVVGARMLMIWPTDDATASRVDVSRADIMSTTEKLAALIRDLQPRDDSQRDLKDRAIDIGEDLLQTRWLVMSGSGSAIPTVFLVTLVFWLTVTFTSFGLFSPPYRVVVGVFFVCTLSVATALYLVFEMESPFDGLIKVSPGALEYAFERMGR